jgi:hypothetical protein
MANLPSLKIGEERAAADEAELTEKITAVVLQAAAFTSVLEPHRLPHVKSHGCLNATFSVPEDLDPSLKVGIFEKGGSYDAIVRFSNGSSRNQDDRVGDGRGMAIKVFVPGNPPVEQDFLLATEKFFFAKNAEEFLQFTLALTRIGGRKSLEKDLPNLHGILRKSETAIRPPDPLAMEYFSQVPYQFGEGRAVKYSAKPSSPMPVLGITTTLAEAMRKHLELAGTATFDFQVQFQTDPERMPIEDATVEWPEDPGTGGSPFVTVASISLSGPVQDCEMEAFDPWHHLPPHRPLGVINRIRGQVYEKAAAIRRRPKTQNQLTALMTFKEPVVESMLKLKALMAENALANAVKLRELGFIHSARFLVVGDKFAIITSFDFDFDDYIKTFVDVLGDLFDAVLSVMQDAPPTPVREHREEFLAYIKRIRIPPALFYSAYPDLSVQNILNMKLNADSQGKQ